MQWNSQRSAWGVLHYKGLWFVFFDHEMRAVSGRPYKKRRRAKKEVRYIEQGLSRGPFHGAHKYIAKENF